jgi:RNA polymerase sigma factor (sigma-70 family)
MKGEEREAVFQDIYRRNRWRLARLCRIYAAGDEGADLLQDIWIHIWNGLERFRGDAHVDTWVYRVAVNSALMFHRSSGRRQRWLEPGLDVEVLAQQDAAGAEAGVPERLRRRLYHCVSLLKSRDRLVVSLHLEGLQHGAIAEIVGVTAGHAAVLLHRLKPVLADCVQGGNDESV